MNIKHLGNGVVLIENLLSKEDLDLIDLGLIENTCPVQGYRNVDKKTFLEGGYQIDLEKDSSNIPSRFKDNIESLPFFEIIDQRLYSGIVEYCKIFPSAVECITNCVGKHFVKYTVGNLMGCHCDCTLAYKEGTLQPNATTAPIGNTVTVSIALNDDFEGGNIIFNISGVEVRIKAGSAVYYPSSYIGAHQVKPVTSGVRWVFLAFYSHGDTTYISDFNAEKHPERYEWMMKLRKDIKNGLKKEEDNLNSLQKKVPVNRKK